MYESWPIVNHLNCGLREYGGSGRHALPGMGALLFETAAERDVTWILSRENYELTFNPVRIVLAYKGRHRNAESV